MGTPPCAEPEARLLQPPEPGRFGAAELEGLPELVRRHLTQAIAPGTPLVTSARLRMRGQIKVGRWLPFRAHQVLNPQVGAGGGYRPGADPASVREGGCGRSHSEARVGCMVWSTTASSSPWRASRSTWSRSRAANPSTVRAAS
jgi:hypothetical protein